MVTLYKAECPCGFKQDELRVGYRPDYKIFRFDIHLCPVCNRLFDCWDEDPVHGPPCQTFCPECEEEPTVTYTYKEGFDTVKHRCPRCQQQTLSFTPIGEWAGWW